MPYPAKIQRALVTFLILVHLELLSLVSDVWYEDKTFSRIRQIRQASKTRKKESPDFTTILNFSQIILHRYLSVK